MKPYPSAYTLLAAFMAATCAATRAMEGVTPNDVSILACHAERSSGPSTDSGTDVAETGHGVRIIFQNRGTVDLSRVTFVVQEGGQRVVDDAEGRFSPGARIDRYFSASDLLENDTPACSVVAVQQLHPGSSYGE